VFDAGHYSFRAGYAGEDMPKVEIPSMVGISEEHGALASDITPTNGSETNGNSMALSSDLKAMVKKYTIGTTNIHVPKAGT